MPGRPWLPYGPRAWHPQRAPQQWGRRRQIVGEAETLDPAAISVELPGIEPGSYGIPSRLLRAQFALSLLGSPGHANKPGMTIPVAVSVPISPATELSGRSL